jgi:hypothetical protein
MKEEFKLFVRKKPELVRYVNEGSMTWQKFYEQWNLYGEDNEIWNNYKKEEQIKKEESFNMSNITEMIKKIDMNSVQKGVNSLQKMVELLQGFVTKDAVSNTSTYEPRQLFKKFED